MILTCKECGEELSFTELDLSKEELIVEPCKECTNKAYDDGYERGEEEGYKSGEEDGYEKGYDKGYEAAENNKEDE